MKRRMTSSQIWVYVSGRIKQPGITKQLTHPHKTARLALSLHCKSHVNVSKSQQHKHAVIQYDSGPQTQTEHLRHSYPKAISILCEKKHSQQKMVRWSHWRNCIRRIKIECISVFWLVSIPIYKNGDQDKSWLRNRNWALHVKSEKNNWLRYLGVDHHKLGRYHNSLGSYLTLASQMMDLRQ